MSKITVQDVEKAKAISDKMESLRKELYQVAEDLDDIYKKDEEWLYIRFTKIRFSMNSMFSEFSDAYAHVCNLYDDMKKIF